MSRLEDDESIFIVWDEWRTPIWSWWYFVVFVALFVALIYIVPYFGAGSMIPLLYAVLALGGFLFYVFVPFVHTRPFVQFDNTGEVFLLSTYNKEMRHRVTLGDILSFELQPSKNDPEYTSIYAVMKSGFMYPLGHNNHGQQKNLMRIAAIKQAHAEALDIHQNYA